ncbi:hypothetical protein FGO68_gene17078 [Halteria grandinella]|uniref:Uncharacterized protein n=1 Tax=Halteria grandinella TaxID=5974 RepID=A0A8J8P012_HALGN|nr:hypothetical protein FGO68_gene17078 [Halteria grandinella]
MLVTQFSPNHSLVQLRPSRQRQFTTFLSECSQLLQQSCALMRRVVSSNFHLSEQLSYFCQYFQFNFLRSSQVNARRVLSNFILRRIFLWHGIDELLVESWATSERVSNLKFQLLVFLLLRFLFTIIRFSE